ncbi:hypothetical protein [Maridesulfovibrio sp.]|uniref:hypothetical protein n=1 Tax=Maridesulfovibrio sp. TaxID=2795000 RepID=UPI003B002CE0
MQVVAAGFIVGVIQDSAETALNSSTDVIFTAAADRLSVAKSQVKQKRANNAPAAETAFAKGQNSKRFYWASPLAYQKGRVFRRTALFS